MSEAPCLASRFAGAVFLSEEPDAGPVGMGRASTALPRDGAVQFWNPAGLSRLSEESLSLSHIESFGDRTVDFARVAISLPGPGLGFAASGYYSRIENLVVYDNFGIPLEKTRVGDFVASVSAAKTLGRRAAAGVSIKPFQSNLAGFKGQGTALDVGFLYELGRDWGHIGASVSNLGTGIRFVQGRDPLPARIRLAWARRIPDAAEDQKVVGTLEMMAGPREEVWALALGLEFLAADTVAFRGGARLGTDRCPFTAGLGFIFKSFSLDYAILPAHDLGWAHRLSFTGRWPRRKARPSTAPGT